MFILSFIILPTQLNTTIYQFHTFRTIQTNIQVGKKRQLFFNEISTQQIDFKEPSSSLNTAEVPPSKYALPPTTAGHRNAMSRRSYDNIITTVVVSFSTVISYGWVTGSGDDDSKRKLYATSDNGRVLGPICLVVSVVMFVATAVLRILSANARFRQTRVGFHCPVHGDFFPISPGPDPRKFSCESPVTGAKKKTFKTIYIKCINTIFMCIVSNINVHGLKQKIQMETLP